MARNSSNCGSQYLSISTGKGWLKFQDRILSKIRRIVEKINILLSSRIVGLLVGERLRIFEVEEILLPISICLLQAFDESTRNLHLKGIMHLDDMKMLILLSHPQRNAS